MTDVSQMDFEEQVARIQRMQEETRKFALEQHKIAAETRKTTRDMTLSGSQLVIAGMTAGAALVGATAAFIKVFG